MKLLRSLAALVAAMLLSVEATAQVSAVTGAVAPQECTVAQVQAGSCGPKLKGLRIVIKDGATAAECGNAGDLGLQSFENVCRWSDSATAWLPDEGGVPANIPQDFDGDGNPEYIKCSGDYNASGTVNAKDIDDCIKALTDTDGITVRVVGTGTYGVAGSDITNVDDFYNCEPFHGGGCTGTGALVSLPSNSRLMCVPGVIIEGWDETAPNGTLAEGHVISNSDHVSGNSNIRIQGCEIDGGAPVVAFSELPGFRTGIYWEKCSDCWVEDSIIKRTFHACIYQRNGDGLYAHRNRFEDCGSHHSNAQQHGQPAVYTFSSGTAQVTRNISIIGNQSYRSGSVAWNSRAEDTDDVVENVLIVDNYAEDAGVINCDGSGPPPCDGGANPIYHSCFNLKVKGGIVTGNTCRRTNFTIGAGVDYDDGNSPTDIVITGNEFYQMRGGSVLGPFTENVVIEGNIFRTDRADPTGGATRQNGLSIRTPNRNLIARSNSFYVTKHGLEFGANAAPESAWDKNDPRESMLWEGNYFEGYRLVATAGALEDGIHTNGTTGDIYNATFRGNTWKGFTRGGVRCNTATVSPWDNVTFENETYDMFPDFQRFKGVTTIAGLGACDAAAEGDWKQITDASSGSTCVATGGTVNECRCVSNVWTDANNWANFTPALACLDNLWTDVSFDGIKGLNVLSDHVIYVDDQAHSNVQIGSITALCPRLGNGLDSLSSLLQCTEGAVSVNGGAAVTTLQGDLLLDQTKMRCQDHTGSCLEMDVANLGIAPGSLLVESGVPPSGNCFVGSTYIQTDGVEGATFYDCEGPTPATGTWQARTDDSDVFHKSVTGEIAGLTDKPSPVGADVFIIEDSAAGNAKKKVSILNLPGARSIFTFVGAAPITSNPDALLRMTNFDLAIDEGYVMPYSGSVVAASCFYDVTGQTAAGVIAAKPLINNVTGALSANVTTAGIAKYTAWNTQSPGIDTFVAGNKLLLAVDMAGDATYGTDGTFGGTLDDYQCTVAVEFD